MTSAAAIMLQGTGSDAGKSLLTAGLCRLFSRMGLKVRPFKPQNMSNNAAVTQEGGEIGRAQALQARACGVAPSIHMNPVLLKPEAETGAQVIVQGRRLGQCRAGEYGSLKPRLMERVLESFGRLCAEADIVVVEGAGSPAEVNLRHGDIANMGFAEAAGVPVILVADIDRGGVIANLVGTHSVMTGDERARVQGFIVNKFRGDVSLFADGARFIAGKTGWSDLGVVPWFHEAQFLPAEDSVGLGNRGKACGDGAIKIGVPLFPRIANHDDFDPLAAESDVDIQFVRQGEAFPGDLDLIVLPGSKSVIADLRTLMEEGWDVDIKAHLRRGGKVLGICGGYQMLGSRISDPGRIEGEVEEICGLELLGIETVLTPAKRLADVTGRHPESGSSVKGYEMHLGRTSGEAVNRPLFEIDGRNEGARSADGLVAGTYVHGLFADDGFRHAYLNDLKKRSHEGLVYEAQIEAALDKLADHLDAALDSDAIMQIARAFSRKVYAVFG